MTGPHGGKLMKVLRDERGVALPLALIGLVAVSLMVTTALITSSTEAAISTAHQDATQALYAAEGGLQAFVAQNGVALTPSSIGGNYVPPGGTAADAVIITTTHLGDRSLGSEGARLRLFSVAARSVANGSREVVAMLRQIFPPGTPFKTNVQSAVTLSGDLHVQGNAFTINGRVQAGDSCAAGGVAAVHHAQDSDITVNNPNHWDNFLGTDADGNSVTGTDALKNSNTSKEEMIRAVLGLPAGMTLDDFIARIPPANKWGPRYTPQGAAPRVFNGTVAVGEGVAVVDGDGKFVDLYGVEGLLIIVNGHLRMRGNSSFKGIIIVEGNFDLAGTPTVRGALISMDDVNQNVIDLDESAIGAGHVTVQYDACMIRNAENAYAKLSNSDIPPTIQATLSWMEVVR
ncbi:hypothetical protein BH23GEM6_BH23GEM6_21870 [soil metagenome]